MRTGLIIVLLGLVWIACGCSISRQIAEVPASRQSSLQDLDQHLTYADPYAGRPDYIVPQR